MTDRELVAAAARHGGVSEDEARAGLSATLEALGARLAGGHRRARRLPSDLQRMLQPESEGDTSALQTGA
jgi:plasmid stability protein